MTREEEIDLLMNSVPDVYKLHWCEARACACLGCVQMSVHPEKIKKEEWEAWKKRSSHESKKTWANMKKELEGL